MLPPPLTYKQVAADLPIDIFKKLRGHSQTALTARGDGGGSPNVNVTKKITDFF